MVFEPVHQMTPPFTCPVRWLIPEGAGERVDLVFRLEPSAPVGAAPVFDGGPAILTVPIQMKRDSGPMVRVGDVTGDGVLDVVAVARQADRNGIVNTGVGYIWIGSSTPSGAPDVILELQNPTAGDRLGLAADPGLQLLDLTDDGILDVVLAAEQADVDGVTNAGAVFVFLGHPQLMGTARLRSKLEQVSVAHPFEDAPTGDGQPRARGAWFHHTNRVAFRVLQEPLLDQVAASPRRTRGDRPIDLGDAALGEGRL